MSLRQQDIDTIAANCRRAIDEQERITYSSESNTLHRMRAYERIHGYAEAMRDFAEDVAASAENFGAGFDRARFYRACALNEHGFYTEDE